MDRRHGFEPGSPRLSMLDGVDVEAPLEGVVLVLQNNDQPGVIGGVGTCPGRYGINIASFALGRDATGAVGVVALDSDADAPPLLAAVQEIRALPAVRSARLPRSRRAADHIPPDRRWTTAVVPCGGHPMTPLRATTYAGVASVLVTWLASASGVSAPPDHLRRRPAPVSPPRRRSPTTCRRRRRVCTDGWPRRPRHGRQCAIRFAFARTCGAAGAATEAHRSNNRHRTGRRRAEPPLAAGRHRRAGDCRHDRAHRADHR